MNRGYREFVIDLRNCPVMDSTFMGTLASVGLGLRNFGQGELRLINLNERNRDLLMNLGLNQLLTIVHSPVPAPAEPVQQEALDDTRADKLTEKQTMLEAHEACVEVDGANAAKFKDVIDFLKQDLHLVR